MGVEALCHMLQTNDFFVSRYAGDLTHEESLVRPLGQGNSFYWVLGHMVVYRDALLETLGQPRLHPEAERAHFKRNADPSARATPIALETLAAEFETAGARLREAMASTPAEQLASAYDAKFSIEQRLVHLTWHESYHAGQLALLHRLAGKERVV